MELIDTIQQLAKLYVERKAAIQTEEATKNALIMPFISALGYNVFDPSEVVPEFVADVGSKKGEKVDYAILKDGKPIMLIEAKWCGDTLDVSKEGQLLRYFNVTPASVGILTNGHEYRFYTDLDQENIMDQRPFLQFDIAEINEQTVRELKKFAKTAFNIDEIVSTASELKYTGAMKAYLSEQLGEPTEDFVKFMAKQVFEGVLTEKARDKFKVITKKAFTQFISDRVSDRLTSALSEEKAAEMAATEPVAEIIPVIEEEKNKIVTTQDEIDAYNIVKSILRQKVSVSRVVMKDTINYCGVLLDGNVYKSLCRFYFNNPTKKSIALIGADRKWSKNPISDLNDIYNYTDVLVSILEGFLQGKFIDKTNADEPEGE
ncbi:hypothetical protein FACS1894187_10410 [Synergistales bacterium]|nr:hypothetical protein FACS1894187_10410 [Synergistales bacterium]